jgi:sortase A
MTSGAVKGIERCLWAIGFLALAVWIAVWLNARRHQAEGNQELERRLGERVESPTRPTEPAAPKLAEGDLIGRIEIPRLRMSTVVFEGTGDGVLRIGVGHLAGSPLPGERGNVVLAAHRDTFFRPLRDIRKQDVIDVVTPNGMRRYRVDSTTIVTPDHTEVLGPVPGATLTLVTCYPFDWFGHAPKRFIVRAHEFKDREVTSESRVPPPKPQLPPTHAEAAEVMRNVDYVTPIVTHTVRPRPVEKPIEEIVTEAEPEPTEEVSPEAGAAKGNRMMRGLKKLNPKRLKSIF